MTPDPEFADRVMRRVGNKVEEVRRGERLYALVLRDQPQDEGTDFITPKAINLQVGRMSYPRGHRIPPHAHLLYGRVIEHTVEVLWVVWGRIVADLYDEHRVFLQDVYLNGGDLIVLAAGGHGFTWLEPSEVIEVKQGPYVCPEVDKELFDKEETR